MQSAVDTYLSTYPEARQRQHRAPLADNAQQQDILYAPAPREQYVDQLLPSPINNNDDEDDQIEGHQIEGEGERVDPEVIVPPRAVVRRADSHLINLPVAVVIDPRELYQSVNSIGLRNFKLCKALLLGDANAGKTHFLSAIINENNCDYIPTVGIDFKILTLNDVKFIFHDLAGQERFRPITVNYRRTMNFGLVFGNGVNDIERQVNGIREGNASLQIYGLRYDRDANNTLIPSLCAYDSVNMPQDNAPVRVTATEAKAISLILLPLLVTQMALQPAEALGQNANHNEPKPDKKCSIM